MNIADKSYTPTIEDLQNYINNPLFNNFLNKINEEYAPKVTIEYSSCSLIPGWNIKFKKAGKALCTLYPGKGSFMLLIVVGQKEKDMVEFLLPQMSDEMQKLYKDTKEGMGQRWLIPTLSVENKLYFDCLDLIKIRRYNKI